ncbi:helix-turn-helix domain-containing protein [Victivallis sp. Marseille-Q1083]|uniref:helix-turn-helix domain-containing protein n=1 Tax=Victivallis sp. Marseille-Q1083 TaxID=2717288 RepID=UPI00158B4BCA|nr:helix-turn-helix transcriptional regulator [Victivallis sp. Marseille-Q1083]
MTEDKYNPVPHDHEKFMKKVMSTEEGRQAYAEAQREFAILDALREAIAESGLTQVELARRMGTRQSNISRLLNGSVIPGWKTVNKVFRATGRAIVKIETKPIADTPVTSR